MKAISLHSHTTFSFMDGHGTPLQHFQEAANLGMSAYAVTEHGNVSSHVGAEKASAKTGVKAIFGLEAYTARGPASPKKYHLTILATDADGYQSLNRIVTESWENFYRWPTVTGEILARNEKGLIVLSGCSDSLVACYLLGGKDIPTEEASYERARTQASRFKEIFGDRFYLEVQTFPELERGCQIAQAYEKMGKKLGIPLVATFDVHTLRPGQHEIRALLHAAGRGMNTIAQQLESWEYTVPDYIPRSDNDIKNRLLKTGLSKKAAAEAFYNTGEVADRCNVTLPKADRFRYNATPADLTWAAPSCS